MLATAGVPIPAMPSPESTPTPRPTPAPSSALMIDSATGRALMSVGEGTTSALLVYETTSGRPYDTLPLAPGEFLLDVDRERRRILLYRPEGVLRVLDADRLEQIRDVALPTPDPGDVLFPVPYTSYGPIEPLRPVLDPATGNLLTFVGARVSFHDVETAQVDRELDLPLPDGHGPIYRAAVTESGRVLYLAMSDRSLEDIEGRAGTTLAAIDLDKGNLVDSRGTHDVVIRWMAWGECLLASAEARKGVGLHHLLWRNGHVTREIFDAALQWTAYDSRRDRLIGAFRAPVYGLGPGMMRMAVGDPASLDLRLSAEGSGKVPPAAYDAETDRFFAHADEGDHLLIINGGDLKPEPAAVESPGAPPPVLVGSVHPFGRPPAPLGLIFGSAHMTPVPLTPTPRPDEAPFYVPVVSRDGGERWSASAPGGLGGWPDCLAASPTFETDAALFGCVDGIGVFRSRDGGRSWQVATDGLDVLSIREIVVSPNFRRDRTVFATTLAVIQASSDSDPLPDATRLARDRDLVRTLWRTTDAGGHWTPVGPYTAVAFSPNYVTDATVMAFGYLSAWFYVSTDRGSTWSPRARLPELGDAAFAGMRLWVVPAAGEDQPVLLALGNSGGAGGGVRWPEDRGGLFSSQDDGRTWDVEQPGGRRAYDSARLLGPLQTGRPSPRENLRWLLVLDDSEVLGADQDALSWHRVELGDDPNAVPISLLAGDRILVVPGFDGGMRAVPSDAFSQW
jgi:hypothetical protein